MFNINSKIVDGQIRFTNLENIPYEFIETFMNETVGKDNLITFEDFKNHWEKFKKDYKLT